MSRNAQGWGRWHPGEEAHTLCEQCRKWHTTEEALALNEKDAEYSRARAWARHKEWVGQEKAPHPEG